MSSDLLRNAERTVRERGLDKILIVDADVHNLSAIKFLGRFIDPPWRRAFEVLPEASVVINDVGDRRVAGRIKRPPIPTAEEAEPRRSIQTLIAALGQIGVDYSVVFPNDLLLLPLHPDRGFQVAVARGYARWLSESVLPYESRIKTMLHLPITDPDACLALVEEFGDKRGVVGFQVTQVALDLFHAKEYLEVYAALQERNLALGFHSDGYWPQFSMFDTFLGAHALSFPAYNAMSLINWVWNGMPERYPRLRCVFFEAGASIIPMVMARLDRVYRARPSDAPLLKRLPSEYMRDFFYTVQPLEVPEKPEQIRTLFDRIGVSQILYASDYPHWDFDMPHSITRMSFLSKSDREAILSQNAVRAFGLDTETLTLSEWKQVAKPDNTTSQDVR